MPPELVVVGSVNLDLVARCERLPRPGETLGGADFQMVPGGKGANQAVAAARLGARVGLVAAAGDDFLADAALAELRRSEVDLGGLVVLEGPPGIAVIVVAADGENQIVVAPGPNLALLGDAFDVSGHEAVLCQLEIPVETVAAAAAQATGMFCLNAAPGRPLPPALLERVDLLIVNPYELAALGIEPTCLTAVTFGADGAALRENGVEVARARPPRVEVVDGTGAGDAFSACLLVSLLEGRPRERALERACAAGALAASALGAQTSLPSARELDDILGL